MKIQTEDDWIAYLKKKTENHKKWNRALLIGDDGAVISQKSHKRMVLCSDTLVEGIHFDLNHISWKDLGWKSLAVNLSDIAAMGATPLGSLLNISTPKKYFGDHLKDFLHGYLKLSSDHKVSLLGGDTTGSPHSLFISVTVLGEVSPKKIKTRSMANPGDLICVTGPLGDSHAGLVIQSFKNESLSEGEFREAIHLSHRREDIPSLSSVIKKSLLSAHYRPIPRVEEGIWLGRQSSVTSMMDLSDGLAKDLTRLCHSSEVRAQIDGQQIPISKALKAFAQDCKKNPLELALFGGEDYELLFTCKEKSFSSLQLRFQKKFKKSLFALGKILPSKKQGPLLEWLHLSPNILAPKPFEHF
ncbi:MAG: thiamine-phosphate kinase [Bdellovibrionaceae bacterium]|nr:thiamine-phosphate kinase [Pseudobdellovibrionaceae bacterium]|tara:strand:- start:1612 stop:2682 length:1071 start_codon:yes stop_codon:yes gene_type:complete